MSAAVCSVLAVASFVIGWTVLTRIKQRIHRRRRTRATLESQLRGMRDYAQARIDAGDLDLDDLVYPTRDACSTLLRLHFGDRS